MTPFLVTQQGDGVSGFREIMIRQNADDTRRKLLETQTLHFIIFVVNDEATIVGFDLEDRNGAHVFQWRRGKPPRFYGVMNIGSGYHNRDEVYVNGRFSASQVAAELQSHGQNIRNEVREVLLEGINAHH